MHFDAVQTKDTIWTTHLQNLFSSHYTAADSLVSVSEFQHSCEIPETHLLVLFFLFALLTVWV